MWQPIDDIEATRFPPNTLKRAKLYADEDIEDEVVEWLRQKGINIIGARELCHKGKPDSFHAGFAFRKKRFILTKNAKHYFDDRRFPPHRIYGIIAVEGDMGNTEKYFQSLSWIFAVVPYGELYEGMKIRLTPNEVTMRFVDIHGRKRVYRVKHKNGRYFEWVEKT